MTNYFVDSTTGDDGDDGTTMDLAWAKFEHAVEAGGLAAGDTVWVRRIHAEPSPGGVIIPIYTGSAVAPIKLIGWPRAADASITEADWTNGSATVDTVVGLSMDREKHQGRYITAPDGNTYMIARVVDSDTFVVLNEYVGPTVTTTGGACTIHADEDWVDDMGTEYGFDDSGWTIKEAAWDADADDLALLDFDNHSAGGIVLTNAKRMLFANFEFRDTTYVNGLFLSNSNNEQLLVRGCLFHQDQNQRVLLCLGTHIFFDRCVFEGSGAGANQNGPSLSQSSFTLRNCAIYNFGNYGLVLQLSPFTFLENVNIGVEIANANDDIVFISKNRNVEAVNLALGGSNGTFVMNYPDYIVSLTVENYNKILGANKTWNAHGELTKVDVVSGSGDPYKRSSGADSVIEILYNLSQFVWCVQSPTWPETTGEVFSHEFEATTDSRRYRYYVQSEKAVLASELWIEVEYVSVFDDATRYVTKKVRSDEAISIRGGVSDWTQYIEVEDIEPAVGSTVRIKCYCSFYDATDKIYIDPLCEVTT